MIDPNGVILCAAEFDDGSGTAIYIGGEGNVSGGTPGPSGFGRIRDGQLEVIGGILGFGNISASVRALLVHDDGTGPALYVAGTFRTGTQEVEPGGVVRWRNGAWESFGLGLTDVYALAEFDEDGDGPAPPRLFAGGDAALGGAIRVVARWDGQSWTAVGGGFSSGQEAHALIAADDGTGPALYAGGDFGSIGGVPVHGMARWNGVEWSAVGGGLPPLGSAESIVDTLVWHDDGNGGAIYAGGNIVTTTADGPTYGMAKWDGGQWRSVGLGVGSDVRGAVAHMINGVEEFVVVGRLRVGSGPLRESVARWVGGAFELLPGQPAIHYPQLFSATCQGAARHGDGVLILGRFDSVGDSEIAQSIAVWDGRALRPILEHGGLAQVSDASAVAIDPTDGSLYLGGDFGGVGGHVHLYLARRDEGGWSSVGDGLDGWVNALAVHDAGDGARLFAGGNFMSSGGVDLAMSIAMFDGAAWSRVGTLNNGQGLSLASIGGDLYAGGNFGSVDGVAGPRIARWDGDGWHSLGAGLSGGSSQVRAIIPWNGGVAVGGSFTNSAGMSLRNVAFWNGKQWTPFGEGLNFTVRALAEYGGDLYAGGEFTQSGLSPVRYIARWDGTAWRPLAGQLSGPVRAARVFDDGTGPRLYIAGSLGYISGAPYGSVAAWDGESWSALDAGVNGRVDALEVYTPTGASGRRSLVLSGVFTSASGVPSFGIAEWRGCLSACPGDANGDQVIDMADLMIVVDAFNTSEGDALFDAAADFDLNGVVDFEDLNRVIAAFNMGC